MQTASSEPPNFKPRPAPAARSMRAPPPTSALDEEERIAHASTAAPARQAVVAKTFASAGLGNAVSAAITNPFDVIKVRQQLLLQRSHDASGSSTVKPNFWSLGKEMARTEGVRSLWSGVTASCLRELSYSTLRMGGYEPLKEAWSTGIGISQSSFLIKVLAGVTSGAIGAAVASPTDLIKVRMQAARPSGKPPYANTFVGFVRVYQEGALAEQGPKGFSGGVKSLWRGVGPTIFRAAVLTSSQIATYDQVKHALQDGTLIPGVRVGEGVALHFASSMVAGFVCSVTSQPIDVIKTRIMHDKERKHSGSWSVVARLLKQEGPLAFYKGFAMCWGRLGLHTTISLVLFEQFRALFGIKPL